MSGPATTRVAGCESLRSPQPTRETARKISARGPCNWLTPAPLYCLQKPKRPENANKRPSMNAEPAWHAWGRSHCDPYLPLVKSTLLAFNRL